MKRKEKSLTILLVMLLLLINMFACNDNTPPKNDTDNSKISPYVFEPDKGEGYEHIIFDRAFNAGFGASWIYGRQFSQDFKKGEVLSYQDIGRPIYIIPIGLATQGVAVNGLLPSSGLENNTYWEFEEGVKNNFTDVEGKTFNLDEFRLSVDHSVKKNNANELIVEQYNNYLHNNYPAFYSSNPKLVKRIKSNKHGVITMSYNSFNDISNSAYSYGADFIDNTWPHLLLMQNFKTPIDMAMFSEIEFSMTLKLNKANQINKWPADDFNQRFDQPKPPEGAPFTNPECTMLTYFFLRSKSNPYMGCYVGILHYNSTGRYNDHLGVEQWGISFFNCSAESESGDYFDLQGKNLEIGRTTTVSFDLLKYVNFVLIRHLKCNDPNSSWYGMTVDDMAIYVFNTGFEYIGNWDAEVEISNIYARGILKQL